MIFQNVRVVCIEGEQQILLFNCQMLKMSILLICRVITVFVVVIFECVRSEAPIVVLVTGGSTGIGKATALKFARHGSESESASDSSGAHYKVWASMRDVEAVNRWGEAQQGLPKNLRALQMDVTDEVSVQRAVQQIIAEDGRIDVLVNNAGYGVAGCLEVVSIEEAKNVFDVNVWGVVRVLQAVLPHMRNAALAGKG